MDAVARLKESGFSRVIVLDAAECTGGKEQGTLLLAVWTYEMERCKEPAEAWIHPYYVESHRARTAAVQVAAELGGGAAIRPDIRLKPIFARLPMFTQGRNTLSYLEGVGSRFQVQIILLKEQREDVMHLEAEDHALHCGDCKACIRACPNGAISEDGFHRERCIREWMMSGQPIPEHAREAMGSRLIGCDECQRCCPHNPAPEGDAEQPMLLADILDDPKGACAKLAPLIGSNMAFPNRVLSQACVMAGSAQRTDLLEKLDQLAEHPSPTVQEHAAWAGVYIRRKQK